MSRDAARAAGAIRVGTRRSALATRQAGLAIEALQRANPGTAFEIVELSSEGDERRDISLRALGGSGVFVKRLELALLDGAIDLAIHSLKDVPTQLEPGLTLAGYAPREDPRDALVVAPSDRPEAASPVCALADVARNRLAELPYGARVGTGSARRAAQLLALRDDLDIRDIRGNVDTRLRKLDHGEVDGLVLAMAGLIRLDRADRVTRRLDPDDVVPMVGQGALAIEARSDDTFAVAVAASIDDPATRRCVETERAFLRALGGGCALPIGALAELTDGELRLRVMLGDEAGHRLIRREIRCPAEDGDARAAELAVELLATATR